MQKETLTIKNVLSDLTIVAEKQMSCAEEWRFTYIIPVTMLAISVGVFFKSLLIGLLIFSFAAYHIFRYVLSLREYKEKRRALSQTMGRGDLCISTEIFSHVASEQIYEPHTGRRNSHAMKTVTVFHFKAGGSWRMPEVTTHYAWSREFYLSSAGLDNISVEGNEFFRISLLGYHEIAYIYPCKFFELSASLAEKKK